MLTALTPDLYTMFFATFTELYISFFYAAMAYGVPVRVPVNVYRGTCPEDDFSHEEAMQLPIILMFENEEAESPPQ